MKVTIYGKPQCPLCDRSKALVEARGIDFEYIDFVAANMTREELSVIMGRPVSSVPQILVDGCPIGSYPELVDHLRKAKEEEVNLLAAQQVSDQMQVALS